MPVALLIVSMRSCFFFFSCCKVPALGHLEKPEIILPSGVSFGHRTLDETAGTLKFFWTVYVPISVRELINMGQLLPGCLP